MSDGMVRLALLRLRVAVEVLLFGTRVIEIAFEEGYTLGFEAGERDALDWNAEGGWKA